MSNMTTSIETRPPVPAVEYVVVINGMVTVAYRHRSDARLRCMIALPGSTALIYTREAGTGRWIGPAPS